MNDKIKVSDLAEFDMAEQLRSEEDIAEYLSMVLEDGDTNELIRAVGYVAKARGMTQIAQASGLGRESLYKALRVGAKPQFETISKVLGAMGVGLKVVATPIAKQDNHAVAH
ncbi:addiction module antidote protein [Spongiibacter tropicus]|uniref:addiction module antidote protein n=1 Tax=Spongiibacter tropicus TaxID=454602 RepID=UPI0003B7A29B|nr:addiction module antidote protein [Spongiibacter tropicus]